MTDLHKLLSVQEIADVLNLAKITIYKMVSAREIPFIKIGSRVLFDKNSTLDWIEEQSIKPIKTKKSKGAEL